MPSAKQVAAMTITVVVTASVFLSLGRMTGHWFDCYSKWKDSGIEYRYSLRGGCQLKHGEGWIPASAFRVN